MLFFALYRVFKSKKLISFDSPVETGVVKGFPPATRVFVSQFMVGFDQFNRTHFTPHPRE